MVDRLLLEASELLAATAADPREPHLVLWNTSAYYDLRPGQLERRRQIDLHDGDRLVGSFVVGVDDDGAATSGFGAPFGGPDLARSAEVVGHVEALVDQAVAELEAGGAPSIAVRAKPAHYGPNEAALVFALVNRGFAVVACDLNAHLDLRGIDSGDAYVASLKPAARKALRRSVDQGIGLSQVAPDDAATWAEAYEVLRRNRVDRGRPMHLPLAYVEAIRDAFPGRVRLLVVDHGDRVVAAALLYRVAPGRDVVQYWGDALHDLALSPMNLLVRGVVEHALASGTATVDIGISSEDGVTNAGLIQFKRTVGCDIEPRFVLRRTAEG
ncbi:GNAT family N-acetyltransferase [Aquihabitans sp. G128]|uniref:GNAT family N-acetyltransferase n=1 Tax=Aquihabitans sp. G128 TaxID=2849779 RepID=UPI001C23F17F|nr:GNAT family N-acetyltransferase [Aquihabitans sp. G128]QXC61705.1 GNAT family N-acetyltransferase [Aquihabitans sp. G128]